MTRKRAAVYAATPLTEHTLIWPTGARPRQRSDASVALYDACDWPEPMMLAEAAVRLALARGVVKTLATDLVAGGHLAASVDADATALRQALDADMLAKSGAASGDGFVQPQSFKVLVAGGPGVGKSAFIGAASDVTPTHIKETMPAANDVVVPLRHRTTSVTIDLGRIKMSPRLTLGLFGAPGDLRFGSVWNDLLRRAGAALVLVHPDRVTDARELLGRLNRHACPVAILVNLPDRVEHDLVPDASRIRGLLQVGRHVPVAMCNARNRGEAHAALRELLRHAARSHQLAPLPIWPGPPGPMRRLHAPFGQAYPPA